MDVSQKMKKLSLIIFFIISNLCFADVDIMWLPAVVEKTYGDKVDPTIIRFVTELSKEEPMIRTAFSLRHRGTVWEADDTLLQEIAFYADSRTYVASSPTEKERFWIHVGIRPLKPPKEKTTESSLVMMFVGARLVSVEIEHRNDDPACTGAMSWWEKVKGTLKKKKEANQQPEPTRMDACPAK